MMFYKYLIFTYIICNDCILSNFNICAKEGVTELDEQFERLPDGHEAKRSYYLGFRQAQSEARPNIVISLLKLN